MSGISYRPLLIREAPDCLRVAGKLVSFHVLRDGDGLYLIDGGCFYGRAKLAETLHAVGWERLPLKGILVTHGHIDHIWNVGRLARDSGAWIAAPPGDAARYRGEPRVEGAGGPLAMVERHVFRLPGFLPFTPDRWLEDGDELPVWGGLQVVHLPGHTAGHSGFFSKRHGLLFSADLFGSFTNGRQLPPQVFNEDEKQIRRSIVRALALEPQGLLPNHGDGASAAEHLQRLRKLAQREGLLSAQAQGQR